MEQRQSNMNLVVCSWNVLLPGVLDYRNDISAYLATEILPDIFLQLGLVAYMDRHEPVITLLEPHLMQLGPATTNVEWAKIIKEVKKGEEARAKGIQRL